MATLYLVRHGRAAAGWDQDADPGLDEVGRMQAHAMAERVAPLGPLQLVTSPMRRCVETAAPLAAAWGREPTVERGVSEVTSPTPDLKARTQWLRGFLAGGWSEADADRQVWRANVIRALLDLPQDTVVVTHFVVINTAVAQATGAEKVVSFHPDNCSVTVLRTVMDELHVVELGAEMDTQIL